MKGCGEARVVRTSGAIRLAGDGQIEFRGCRPDEAWRRV
jgi:hypothetical protein